MSNDPPLCRRCVRLVRPGETDCSEECRIASEHAEERTDLRETTEEAETRRTWRHVGCGALQRENLQNSA